MPTPTPEPGSKPSLRKRLQKLIQALESLPRAEMTRGQRMLKFLRQLWLTAYQQLRQDRAGSNAAALAFRTLFSMLPILILAALLTKAVISEATFLQSIDKLMTWLNMDEVRLTMTQSDGTQTIALEDWISTAARSVTGAVSSLTWIGILVVLYSAVRLIEEVDSTFNFITRSSPQGWIRRRIWVYLGVLLLAPIVTIAVGLLLDWGVREFGKSIEAWPWVVPVAQTVITLLLVCWLLRLCYRMIPACVIRKRPATLGAASATVLLVFGQWALTFYIDRAIGSSPLGGSLGFLPVFMFWVYMMWLSILFGLEITMVAQSMGDLRASELRDAKSASSA